MSSILSDVHLAYHVLGRLVARDLEEAAVSMSEALVLRVATVNPRVAAQGLLNTTGLPASTLSSLLARLEERHYVRLERLGGDRRYTLVRPTRVGAAVGRMVESSLGDIEGRVAEQITPAERAGLTVLAEGLFAVERPERPSPLG
jgi:DNA-binding MarR family transcriptional regulator